MKETLRTELPLNRKEKFYTGTILPALLLHNGFSNLYQFLHAIPGFPAQINEQNTKDNLLLYTEYNLKESAGKKNVGIEIETDRRDTPDAIIEIITPLKVFVVIEAKMFANPTLSDFNSQMQDQKKTVVDTLEKAYQPHDIFHVALLPRQLGFSDTANYNVINWQFFLNNPELDLQDNYFFPYLQFALENYDKLVSIYNDIIYCV